MKSVSELVHYTHINNGPMREWSNREYKHAEELLNQWIKSCRIASKKDNELIRDFYFADLGGSVIFQNYISALIRCGEEYSADTVTDAVDILLQEMAEKLSYQMRTRYPCLRHMHYVVMRANKMMECVMYIGPYGFESESAYRLFCDGGMFMTQGLAACSSLTGSIGLFQ